MRILLVAQYFDPEPHLKGLVFARELVRQGHEVEVLTGFPNYPGGRLYPGYRLRLWQREVVDGIRITRVPLYPSHDGSALNRALNYLSFAFSAALLGPWLVTRPQAIHAHHGNATTALPAWVLGMLHGAPYLLDIQDLWPDSIAASGMLPRRAGFFVPLMAAWCRFIYRQAGRISALSPGMRRTLIARGVPAERITVIPNWCDEAQAEPGPLEPGEAPLLAGRFNVLFAGNMGVMQGLEVVLEAAARLAREVPDAQFVLVGDGVVRAQLEAEATARGLANVRFLPRRPAEAMGGLLHAADALLVHLKDDPLFEVTIPSKIQAYLAAGRPILCGVKGDGADLVREAGAGLLFPPEDAGALAEAVLALMRMPPARREALGAAGRSFYRARLSVTAGTAAFVRALRAARGESGGPYDGEPPAPEA
ncbi:MAG TPA: glycosyltransferase family 4 protein [Holophagaceae bacterium]|nr:glycosyltransferase family 4 protein [Holophagaceae bacterium]